LISAESTAARNEAADEVMELVIAPA